ncbi:MAG: hypothetical protein K0S20_504 [Patescibacteria group bacterium]|jgi:hypothetical protein|nr:hypothetical protein [Patescibacteria group bacterium]
MKNIIESVLSDKSARSTSAVSKIAIQNAEEAYPWYDEAS